MVAALNCYWPEGMIYRSTDSGDTWSPIWSWSMWNKNVISSGTVLTTAIDPYPTIDRYFTYNDTAQPWLGPDYTATGDELQLNVMMEGLSIDPFNSDHWLYGTGGGVQGGYDLTKWDTVHNMTLEVLTVGIEETVINDLIVPPGGAPLISAVDDSGGQHATTTNRFTSEPLK
jgi:xyloglucan-specific exo-beta-1,4-glucanase